MTEPAKVHVALDTTAIRRETAAVTGLARGMGAAFTGAFRDAVVEGQSLGGVLRDLGLRLSQLSLTAALRPVEGFLGNVLANGVPGLRTLGSSAASAAVTGTGSIAAPSFLPRSSSASPAAPGVAASLASAPGMSAAPRASSVTVNISTADADSFRRSEAQVSATLARAVARGQRGL